jgi:hypothetical protein
MARITASIFLSWISYLILGLSQYPKAFLGSLEVALRIYNYIRNYFYFLVTVLLVTDLGHLGHLTKPYPNRHMIGCCALGELGGRAP